jgi:hypothetical protein
MRRTDWANIGLCLLAVVLLVVTAPRVSFAEESGSAAHDGSRPPSGENAAGGAGKSEPENKDSDRIDTRITVQPHAPAVRRDEAKELKAKVRSRAASNLRPHGSSAPTPSGGVVRNAIGMPVALPRRQRASIQVVDRPHIQKPNTSPIVSPTASGRGTINGTGLIRPGHAPSGVGGPAKATAGISGTTIRPKH